MLDKFINQKYTDLRSLWLLLIIKYKSLKMAFFGEKKLGTIFEKKKMKNIIHVIKK